MQHWRLRWSPRSCLRKPERRTEVDDRSSSRMKVDESMPSFRETPPHEIEEAACFFMFYPGYPKERNLDPQSALYKESPCNWNGVGCHEMPRVCFRGASGICWNFS